jgi:hypothetical protein
LQRFRYDRANEFISSDFAVNATCLCGDNALIAQRSQSDIKQLLIAILHRFRNDLAIKSNPQRFRFITRRLHNKLCSNFLVLSKGMRSDFAAILHQLHGDCAVISDQYRTDCAVITERFCGDFAAISW